MIRAAPASFAAATTCSPTPPQPITATLSPRRTPAALRTAPAPVTTPQPSSEACHSGMSAVSGTAPAAATTVRCAKHAVIRPCWSVSPAPSCRREVPSISVPRSALRPAGSQRLRRPARQARHCPHDGTNENATRSPGATCVTRSPTASTTPAPSWPSTIGQRPCPSAPSARCTSEWQTPAAATRTSTSSALGSSSSTSSTATGRPRLAQHRGVDPHPTLHCSSASKSGTTPSPGPAGGAMKPSASISTAAGSSQSRRAAGRPGGS